LKLYADLYVTFLLAHQSIKEYKARYGECVKHDIVAPEDSTKYGMWLGVDKQKGLDVELQLRSRGRAMEFVSILVFMLLK